FRPERVIAWTGDNPSSLIGLGLIEPGDLAISLGTSDTVFGAIARAAHDASDAVRAAGASPHGSSGLGPRLRLPRRRLHGAHLLRQRIAGARAGARRVRAGLGRGLGGAARHGASQWRRHGSAALCA